MKAAVIDGALRAAEQLAAAGEKAEAGVIHKTLSGDDMPAHVKMAVSRKA